MSRNKPHFSALAWLIITVANLVISTLAYAAQVTGSIGLTNCTIIVDCLSISVPPNINIVQPIFLPQQSSRILAFYNYDMNQKINISDSRNNGGFTLDLTISDLVNQDDMISNISHTDIAVVSFNNNNDENISVDSSPPDASIDVVIDPDIISPDSEPFTQTYLTGNYSTMPESNLSYFSNGDNQTIVNGSFPPGGGRSNNYSFSLGYIFKTPTDPAISLRDGHYQLNATFTLTSTP